jgi:hypothetical protein
MTEGIGKFLQNVFNKGETTPKPKAINLKELKAKTGIEERLSNNTSSAILTKLDSFDTNGDGYLSESEEELPAFLGWINTNRTNDKKFTSDILAVDNNRTNTLNNEKFNFGDENIQLQAENYRLMNALLDKVNDNGDSNLTKADIDDANGTDNIFGNDDDKLDNLKANAEIVVTEEVAKKAVTDQKAQETEAKNGIVSNEMATAISKGSGITEDAELATWLKTNATILKDKLGLTNGVVAEIMTDSTHATSNNKDNLKSALNNLRLLLDQAIIKKTEPETAEKPASLDELLNLKANEFASPFDKIKRDATLTILLALTQKNDYGTTGEYQAFTGDKPINKAESLMKADSAENLKIYIYGNKGGPGADWFTKNASSTVTADQMTNLSNINSETDTAARGKAWANFYTSTQGNNIKTFAIQYLLNLGSVNNTKSETVPIEGSDNKDKASNLLTMIGNYTVTFDDNKMIVKDGDITKYTISVKKDGIISWDTDGTGALAALKQIFTTPTTTTENVPN